MSSSFYQVDDRPENYRAWQSSFHYATQGVGLTATGQLDLLTKGLGKESSNNVRRLRSVHIANPALALKKVWDRLQECYAAPEIIERSLFNRLDNFPRVSAKDIIKLRELADLFMELQGAKEDRYLQALSYLDTARGIKPIVSKLPYGLQDKWMSTGAKYKDENGGQFPPFEFFAKFLCYEARKRNDPSFTFPSISNSSRKSEKHFLRDTKTAVMVQKTDVSTTNPSKNGHEKGNNNLNQSCLIHHKPHPMKRCKAFRAKTLDDRKSFIKKKGICFIYCGSASHLAKDCATEAKCVDCESTYHDSMHLKPRLPQPHRTGVGEEINKAVVCV